MEKFFSVKINHTQSIWNSYENTLTRTTDTNDPEMKSSFQRGYYLQHIQEVPNWAVTGLSETAKRTVEEETSVSS